jgi:ABC-2 type transport system ATP-binding protein
MIQVHELTKQYGPVRAVDGISFAVDRGEIVGVLGPNGAGKSTTLRILTSYLSASSGTATVAGFDVMTESDGVRQNIGYLPQAVPIYPEMRVDEYLAYRAKLKGVDRAVRNSRIDQCLERCRCREVRRRLIGTLSNGYRQRVGLADALVHNPPILILDEPTAGLDPIQIRETLSTIRDLADSHTVLLSTHILSEVEAVCRRVIIINKGRIGLDRPLADLAADNAMVEVEVRGPADAVAAALRRIDGVQSVSRTGDDHGVHQFSLLTAGGRDLREDVYRAVAAEAGWSLRRLDQRRRRLEDHFVDVVVRGDHSSS